MTASPELLEATRTALVGVADLERTYADQVTTLEPFLLRTEAIASSRIEEELTTVDQLARAQYDIRGPKTARTVKGAIDGLNFLVGRAGHGVDLDDTREHRHDPTPSSLHSVTPHPRTNARPHGCTAARSTSLPNQIPSPPTSLPNYADRDHLPTGGHFEDAYGNPTISGPALPV